MTTEKWSPEAPNGNVRGKLKPDDKFDAFLLFANLALPYNDRARIARLAALAPTLVETVAGLLSIHDSVTQGQERELREEWLPKARALLASLQVTP